MRTALRLGLAAAALAGSAAVSAPASAHGHCPAWVGTDNSLPVTAVAVCRNYAPPVTYNGGTEVCYLQPVDVYVATPGGGGYLLHPWQNVIANRTGTKPRCTA